MNVFMEHLPWAKRRTGHFRYDLSDSAVCTPDLEALGLPSTQPYRGVKQTDVRELSRSLGALVGAPDGRVVLAAGASEANASVFGGLLAPGDEVLVELPSYEPHRAAPRLFGAKVRTFRRGDGSPGALARAAGAAVTDRTRLIVVSIPNNPTGTLVHDGDIEGLEALAGARDLRLLADETFRDASTLPRATLASRGPRWLATSTLTKSYGLGGLRIGWVAGDAEMRAACERAQHAMSAEMASMSVGLALALVPHLETLRARARGILDANGALWRAAAGRMPFVQATDSQATVTWCLPGPGGGDAFAEFAAGRYDLGIVPGRFFGDPRRVRVALGSEPGRFAEALTVFERAAHAFQRAGTLSQESR